MIRKTFLFSQAKVWSIGLNWSHLRLMIFLNSNGAVMHNAKSGNWNHNWSATKAHSKSWSRVRLGSWRKDI